ncbi:MAG: LysM peptidoglycan-binding domain-containing protein [Duncaniella sp.]|nr:LysM peptidoglycan-binding domain-containing protein [Duncaniella sp.]
MSADIHADVSSLPTCTVNGTLYHYYDVSPKETVYSLCRKLGVTKEELVKYNPAVADGLKAGAKLYFPASEVAAQPQAPAGERIVTHHVERGETIFGIANRYGITTQSLIDANPVLHEGLKAGQNLRVIIPVSTSSTNRIANVDEAVATAPVSKVQSAQSTAYVVGKKETLYSIARAHDITVHELEEANPGITTIREGQILNLPASATLASSDRQPEKQEKQEAAADAGSQITVTPASDIHAEIDRSLQPLGEPQSEVSAKVSPAATSIALILPFMLEEETPGKTALRYTEFYKGFLLAVDSLRASGRPIHIGAFDNGGSLEKTRAILAGNDIKDYSIIIGPDNPACLATVANYGMANDVAVINVFTPRDDLWKTNAMMYQSHLPSGDMTEKAAGALADRLAYSKPVFVNLKDVTSDKVDFIADLKKVLDNRGTTYMEIEVNGRLTPADLQNLEATGNYTFIPSTSRQADLNKIMPGILEWQEKAVTPIVKLFGYPEWITFRGETLANMHKLNAVVYTRFYADDDAPRTKDIESKFKKWYGTGMESTIPSHGLLGFDTGMYLLKNADRLTEGNYDGVQNGFSFRHIDGSRGSANSLLYLVHFRPNGETEKIKL